MSRRKVLTSYVPAMLIMGGTLSVGGLAAKGNLLLYLGLGAIGLGVIIGLVMFLLPPEEEKLSSEIASLNAEIDDMQKNPPPRQYESFFGDKGDD